LVAARRTLLNQLRAILFERGLAFAAGRRKLELAVDAILTEEDVSLEPRIRRLVGEIRAEWKALDQRIDALSGEFVALAKADEATRRLVSIPGPSAGWQASRSAQALACSAPPL
jgi:transposase